MNSQFNRSNRIVADLAGFSIDRDGAIADVPCGCPDCDQSIQQGHFACASSPQEMIRLERASIVTRAYDDGQWRWFIAQR